MVAVTNKEAWLSHLDELDQIRLALAAPISSFGDYSSDDLWTVVDGYTNPEPLSSLDQKLYSACRDNIERKANKIGSLLTRVQANRPLDYSVDLKEAFFDIATQCELMISIDNRGEV